MDICMYTYMYVYIYIYIYIYVLGRGGRQAAGEHFGFVATSGVSCELSLLQFKSSDKSMSIIVVKSRRVF